jgi:hypothetical protein
MKPVHIGLLIACGVLAGIVGTKVMTSPRGEQPVTVVAQPVQPAPAAEPIAAEPVKPAEEAAPSPFPEKEKPAAVRKPAARAKRETTVARNDPRPVAAPAQAAEPPAPPAPAVVEPSAAPPVPPAATPEPVGNTIVRPQPPPPPPPEPHKVTIPVGTLLNARLVEALSSERNHAGDTFTATLDQPLVIDGFVIAERGSRLHGKVVDVKESGRVKGVAQMGIALTTLRTADGQNVTISTDTFTKAAPGSVKQDVTRGAAAAGIGAAIGAIAGGGKGAAIGAGVGAAAGVGGAMATRGKPATLESETRLQFRIAEPVTITEKLR